MVLLRNKLPVRNRVHQLYTNAQVQNRGFFLRYSEYQPQSLSS